MAVEESVKASLEIGNWLRKGRDEPKAAQGSHSTLCSHQNL